MNDAASRLNGETYFFRDQGQIDLLRLRLLPELIRSRGTGKTLRLCSAGCASGEEAYSLAMLLDLALPERAGWDIFILGVDVNPAALEKARLGRYGAWSFRLVPEALRQRYFHNTGDGWQLDERIRRMVAFANADLMRDPLPNASLRDMDLILCRNVFIYYGAEEIAAVAGKLADALRAGGYLITGHNELDVRRATRLQGRLLPEGMVYQRAAAVAPTSANVGAKASAKAKARATRREVAATIARAPPSVVPPLVPVTQERPTEAALTRARQAADRGELDLAEAVCREALAADPLLAEAYFLLAQLAQLRGDFPRAGELLEKTLYLDPECVAAHLELAALRERGGSPERARVLRRAALELVRALPGDAAIPYFETNAGEMAQWLSQ